MHLLRGRGSETLTVIAFRGRSVGGPYPAPAGDITDADPWLGGRNSHDMHLIQSDLRPRVGGAWLKRHKGTAALLVAKPQGALHPGLGVRP